MAGTSVVGVGVTPGGIMLGDIDNEDDFIVSIGVLFANNSERIILQKVDRGKIYNDNDCLINFRLLTTR